VTGAADVPSPAELLGLFERMTLIRSFEDAIQELFLAGDVVGTTHLTSGQEAVAVGVCHVLRPHDRVAGTYRGHGHALACGVEAGPLFAEMLGRATGVNGGRAGSMNVTSLGDGYLGSYGIVGGSIAAATGAALAARSGDGVAVAFFGDGATNQAYFHECLNFAAAFRLPVVYVCENNLYGEYTRTTEVSGGSIASRAEALGLPVTAVDGMRVEAVAAAASAAVGRARAGDGPTLVEAATYRFVGHSRNDPGAYRPEGELDLWRRSDPLVLCRDELVRLGVAAGEIDAAEARAHAAVAQARADALAAPWPEPVAATPEFAAAPVAAPSAAPVAGARAMTFRDAVNAALDDALAARDDVLLFGEDVAAAGGVFGVTRGLVDRHGTLRVVDTPISELALAGAAYGAAACGIRPVLEIMFGDFLPLVMDSLVNQATKLFYLDGHRTVPLVVRSAVGAGVRFGAIHSQTPVGWFNAVPGLKIVAPATPGDAYGLLRSAIEDDNPVLYLEHKRLYTLPGEVDRSVVPLGVARTARPGSDLTLVTAMRSVHDALEAAATLDELHGISVEVVDLRTLRPFDLDTVLASVARTNRLLVVEEGPATGGFSADVMAQVTEAALGELDDAWRLTAAGAHVPFSPPLEDAWLPSAERIVASVLARRGG
jgi:2-oxoisovalerate dehydrogenase E1 component